MISIKAFFLFGLLIAATMAAPAEEKEEAPAAAEEPKQDEAPAEKSAPVEIEKSGDDGSWFAGKYDPIFTPVAVPVFRAAYPAIHHAVPVSHAVHAFPAVHPAVYPYSALPAVRVL